MDKRPVALTIIAWFWIVSAAITVISCIFTLNEPMVKEMMSKNILPMPVQYAMMGVGIVIMLACGIGILKGMGWARTIYVIWAAIGFVISFITSPMKMALIPGLVLFAIIVFFLYRPASSQYLVKG